MDYDGLIMKMWIARDKNGRLDLFPSEPYLVESERHGLIWENDYADYMRLPDEAYPEVTFENSPMEVELKLIEK